MTPPEQVGRLEIRRHPPAGRLSVDPQATAAVLRDGWLDTGDLFRVDSDGLLRLRRTTQDRDQARRHHRSIPKTSAAPLEALAWVREVEVIGVPDSDLRADRPGVRGARRGQHRRRRPRRVRAAARARTPSRSRVLMIEPAPRRFRQGTARGIARPSRQRQPQRDPSPATTPIAGQVQAIAAQIFQVDAATLSNDTDPARSCPTGIPMRRSNWPWPSRSTLRSAADAEGSDAVALARTRRRDPRPVASTAEQPMTRAAPLAAWAIAAILDLPAALHHQPSWPSSPAHGCRGRRIDEVSQRIDDFFTLPRPAATQRGVMLGISGGFCTFALGRDCRRRRPGAADCRSARGSTSSYPYLDQVIAHRARLHPHPGHRARSPPASLPPPIRSHDASSDSGCWRPCWAWTSHRRGGGGGRRT